MLLSTRLHLSQERANHRSGTISPLHPPLSIPGAGQSQIRYYTSSPPASISPRSGPITDQVLYLLSTLLHLSQEQANHRSGTVPPLHPTPSLPGGGQSQIRYYTSSPPASISPRSGPITDQVLYLLSTRLHLSQERANHRSGTMGSLYPPSNRRRDMISNLIPATRNINIQLSFYFVSHNSGWLRRLSINLLSWGGGGGGGRGKI